MAMLGLIQIELYPTPPAGGLKHEALPATQLVHHDHAQVRKGGLQWVKPHDVV